MSPEKGILNRFWTGGEGNAYLPYDNILHIREDEEGVLWLASGGGGLIRLDESLPPFPKEEHLRDLSNFELVGGRSALGAGGRTHFHQFTTEDGLSNNNLYAVYEDDFGNLWMSSDYGIIRFNKETNRGKAFLPSDGITHHEFNRISHFKDEEGRIYFGGLNGVTVFNPKDFHL